MTRDAAAHSQQRLLTRLRHLIPRHDLSHTEAQAVAELLADRFRELLAISAPMLPDAALVALPQTRFTKATDLPASGGSHWYDGYWHIVVNARESRRRQRFSAAHELFHVIAHPRLHSLTPSAPGRHPHREGERLADYFAGSLLIPRDHLVWLWSAGLQRLPDLARVFAASEHAVALRLKQVGLIENYWQYIAPKNLPRGAAQRTSFHGEAVA